MNTSDNNPIKVIDVRIAENLFYAILEDGREIGVPYDWFWRLEQASEEQRNNWSFIGGGRGIHWEDVDEDISIVGILKGKPENPARAPESLEAA